MSMASPAGHQVAEGKFFTAVLSSSNGYKRVPYWCCTSYLQDTVAPYLNSIINSQFGR